MAKEFTIKTVWFGDGKTGNVTFEETGDIKVKVWADAPFRDALNVGAKAVAVVDTMPAKGDFPESKVLKSWGGVTTPEKPKYGGGGGGQKLTPEQFMTEKRCITASVALKEAREFHCEDTDPALVIATGKKFFDAMKGWVGL